MGRKISRSKVRELHEKGLYDHEIAERLNCRRASVHRIRKELGLKSNQFVSRGAVRKLHEEGKSDVEIARELKCSQSAVWRIRKRELGLRANYSNRRRTTICRDELWDDYQSNMPLDKMAEKYGYASVQNIRRVIGRIYLERKQE